MSYSHHQPIQNNEQNNINKTLNLENIILALVIEKPEERKNVLNNLTEEMFNDPINAQIFKELKKMSQTDEEIDAIIMMTRLKNDNVFARFADLAQPPEEASAKLLDYCTELQKEYFNKLATNAKTTEEIKRIIEIENIMSYENNSIINLGDIDIGIRERIKNIDNNAIYTRYSELDNIIGSLQGGDLVTLGANTGAGKTAIALNLARMACTQRKKALIFSLEMSARQLRDRMTCMDAKLDVNKTRTGKFTNEELELFEQTERKMNQWPIRIYSKVSEKGQNTLFTIERLAELVKKEKKEKGCDFVIIDYMGLIDIKGNMAEYEKFNMFSRKIKRLAIECDLVILNLVQLNRENEKRMPEKPITTQEELENALRLVRPRLSDIRGTGAIAQDSDIVLMAFRPYFISASIPNTKLEILVAKNRFGEANKQVDLYFNPQTQLILDPQTMTNPA